MLDLSLLRPEHVVEQQLVFITGRQAVHLPTGAVNNDLPQFPYF